MSGSVERVLRLLTVGLLVAVLLLAHLLADTRERLAGLEDELRTVVADCLRRVACEYKEEP